MLRLALALVGGVVLPGGEEPSALQRELLLAAPTDVLPTTYRLSVAPVPAPPLSQLEPRAPACPFEVRAVVRAEAVSDSFAMLAHGDESRLVHSGGRVRALGAEFVIEALEPDAVVLRQGEALVRCELATGEKR